MIFRQKRAPVSARREVRISNKLGLHARRFEWLGTVPRAREGS